MDYIVPEVLMGVLVVFLAFLFIKYAVSAGIKASKKDRE